LYKHSTFYDSQEPGQIYKVFPKEHLSGLVYNDVFKAECNIVKALKAG